MSGFMSEELGEKRGPVTAACCGVCCDYRELSSMSQTQPVQDKVRHNEVARSNIETL